MSSNKHVTCTYNNVMNIVKQLYRVHLSSFINFYISVYETIPGDG